MDSDLHDALGFIKSVAARVQRKLGPVVEFDELVGIGCLAFARAMRRFDPKRGNKMLTYVAPRIEGAMWDSIHAAYQMPRLLSFDERFDSSRPPAPLRDPWQTTSRRLIDALDCLPPLERELLWRRYWTEQGVRSIARSLGICPSTYHLHHSRALRRLRAQLLRTQPEQTR